MTDLTQIFATISSFQGFTITDVSGNEKNFVITLEDDAKIASVTVHPTGKINTYVRAKKT